MTTKADIIDKLAERLDESKAAIARVVDGFFDEVIESLKNGEQVSVPGRGVWKTSERKARKGRNPQTGEEIQIKASTGISFKAGKAWKDAVNG